MRGSGDLGSVVPASGLVTSRDLEADWMSRNHRASWVANSLKARITDWRQAERHCRRAFRQPYMGEPAEWLAGAYAEVAEVFERRLRQLHAAAPDTREVSTAAQPATDDRTQNPNDSNPSKGVKP